jgi:hypothetical protein
MELPIQLKFFKKLELYQELLSENEKAERAGRSLKEIWNMEKIILKYADTEHHHRGSILKNTDIQNMIESKFEKGDMDNELGHISKNLVTRNFAEYASEDKDSNKGIYITREGFLMGNVINDVESKNLWNKNKLKIFYWLLWATVIAGSFTVLINFIKLVYGIVSKLFEHTL